MFDNKNKVDDGRNAIRQDVVYEILIEWEMKRDENTFREFRIGVRE